MTDFLLAAAVLIVLSVTVGLLRVLYGPSNEDRMMAAQLLGTGGIATMLLLGTIKDQPALVNVALTLALLAAFASLAFVKAYTEATHAAREDKDAP